MGTRFASAVAAVRVMESRLLTESDMERLINAESYRDIADILRSGARTAPDTSEQLREQLDNELDEVWEFIKSYTGEKDAPDILLYKSDFHNLKAALKSLMMNSEPDRLFIRPTNLDLTELPKLVAAKRWEDLPEYMRGCAAEVYESLARLMDGQLADMTIDRICLEKMQERAQKSGNDFLIKYAALTAQFADIKTAYRLSLMNKTAAFIETAVCGTPALEKEGLVRAAAAGTETLLGYLEDYGFGELAKLLGTSSAQFEKRCDDLTAELIEQARMTGFGIEPLAAYYIAKETEIRNLRIILVCKDCGADTEIIKERMRMLYV